MKELSYLFSWVERAPFKYFNSGRALKIPKQAQFHPMKYINELASVISNKGVLIYEGTRIAKVYDGTLTGKPCTLITEYGHEIKAQHVIIASHSPFIDRLILQTKIAQYRSYVIGIVVPKDELQ